MDTGYRADPESFARQMATFDAMRQTERDFRAGKFDWSTPVSKAPVNATRESSEAGVVGYPRGFIDLTRLTGKNLPTIEPGRHWK